MAQLPLQALDVSASVSSRKHDDDQAAPRAATLQSELVPLSQHNSIERPEFIFPPRTRLGHNGPTNNAPQPVSRNKTAGISVDQAAYRAFHRQDTTDGQTDDGDNVITQRFPDGKPRIIRYVAQDEKGNYFNHGPWEVRNQSGQVVAKGTYVRGMMDGQWSRQHASDSSSLFATKPFSLFQGPFRSVALFENGKLEGLWTIYDQYGTKIFEVPYREGVRHGTATWFYPNNAKMREVTFKQGLIDREILEFDEAEKIAGRRQYVDGRPIVQNTTFYRPHVKKTEDYYLGAKLKPDGTDDWWEAKPAPYLKTGSETQHGSSMAWFENGQPKKRGQFADGKPVGQFVWWHANGNKRTEGFYVDGQKSRRWTWWYENGMKQFEGIFQDDQPIEIWRAWHANGKLRKENNYSEVPEPVVPRVVDPETIKQTPGEPSVNGPTTEILPSPTEPKSSGTAPEELENITPLEIRSPTTPQGPPSENDFGSDEEEIGTITAELLEQQREPPNTDQDPKPPETNDKSN